MRPAPKRLIKAIFIISVLGFLITNLNFLMNDDEEDYDNNSEIRLDDGKVSNITREEERLRFEAERGQRQKIVDQLKRGHQNSNSTGKNHSHYYLGDGNSDNLAYIKRAIWDANRQQKILNLDKFDLSASESTVVVVVQVHNRTEYLRHLVGSLRKAKDIEKTLIIFSHDFYSDDLNDIVSSIDFCPVMQIFYPYSLQLYAHEFPGEDPKDCPRNVNRAQAMEMNCQNKDYPDKYGHYREAKYSQTKHHWFWKLNHAFDYLEVTKNFNGPVLLIEEDHYLVEDFVPVLQMMYRLRLKACTDCSIITLGTYDKKPSYGDNSPKVDIMNWVSSKHNMGMALTRNVWNEIKKCGQSFCRFDDYNWDWSLHYIGMSCISTKLRVMVMKSPRIFHIGECGLHAKGKNCSPADRVQFIETLLSENQQYLFPSNLVVSGYPNVPRRVPKPNGGWGDLRDHQLCGSFMDDESHS